MPELITKLTALSVVIGDAFLLEARGKKVLVDGGMDKEAILGLLLSKLPNKHIDILICTHYDTDHYLGVLSNIKSRKFTISEVWLPEVLGDIAYTIRKDYKVGLDALRSLASEGGYRPTESMDAEKWRMTEYNEEYSDEMLVEAAMLSAGESYDNDYFYFRWFMRHIEGIRLDHAGALEHRMVSSLFSIQDTVSKIYRHEVNIRWFKYQKGDVLFAVKDSPLPLLAVNCRQTDIHFVKDPGVLLSLLYKTMLSPINRESLNFLFRREGFPEVFFTGDSDLSYRHEVIRLAEGSIVTAPHHGAASAEDAYDKIIGDKLQYVRSDSATLKRPCSTYKALPNKYCTVCQNKWPKKEVVFQYSRPHKLFTTDSELCCCE